VLTPCQVTSAEQRQQGCRKLLDAAGGCTASSPAAGTELCHPLPPAWPGDAAQRGGGPPVAGGSEDASSGKDTIFT